MADSATTSEKVPLSWGRDSRPGVSRPRPGYLVEGVGGGVFFHDGECGESHPRPLVHSQTCERLSNYSARLTVGKPLSTEGGNALSNRIVERRLIADVGDDAQDPAATSSTCVTVAERSIGSAGW